MNRHVRVDTGLALPALRADHRLHGVLDAALGRDRPAAIGAVPWAPARFGLERVEVWREAPEAAQAAVLWQICQETLQEALYIERAGLAFTARMILLAETVDERVLYATFAGDEARHYAALLPWVVAPRPEGAFLDLLADLIETGTRADLVVLVQVVLEGWGLAHYRGLAETCHDPALAAVFRSILRDEARHHGGGLVLVDGLSPAGLDTLAALLGMVAAGPQSVVAALEHQLGPFDRARRTGIFHDLGGEAHALERLGLLRSLLLRAGLSDTVAALEARGCFTPLPSEAC